MARYHDVDYAQFYRLFYPSPVYVISASDGGEADALSAVWVMPASLKPPKVAIAISPERYTYKLIRRSRCFAVNKLPFRYVRQMAFLGDVSRRYQANKVEASGLHLVEGRKEGMKVLREADAVVECQVCEFVEAGDHDLIVGDVMQAYATRAFDVVWDMETHDFATYLGSVGTGDASRRVFISSRGERIETRWPRTEAVRRRERERKAMEQAVLSMRGVDVHLAAQEVAKKFGMGYLDALLILEEMRRQGAAKLTGRISSSDFA